MGKYSVASLTAAVAGLFAALYAAPVRSAKPANSLHFTDCAAEYYLSSPYTCANLTVPIDYAYPDGGTLDLWVARLPARNASRGTLVFNFGGPGESASLIFQAQAFGYGVFADGLLDHLDIVALDTRGVRYSTPLACDGALWNAEPSVYEAAASEAAYAALVAYNRRLGQSCVNQTSTAGLVEHMDTITVTEDLEQLRRGLGVDTIHYLGLSYGTLLGQTYAARYGEHVERMALDSVVDHAGGAGSRIRSLMAVSSSLEGTLHKVFAWCNTTGSAEKCALYGQDQAAIYQQLIAPDVASEQSLVIPAGGCTSCPANVTRSRIALNTPNLISFENSALVGTSWASFAESMAAAYYHNNASGFASVQESGTTSDTTGASQYVYRATLCQDWGLPPSSAANLALTLDLAANEQPVGRGMNWPVEVIAFCAGWPTPVRYPAGTPATPNQLKPGSLLVSNGFWDPETPAQMAMSVGDQNAGVAVNIWRNGSGHTSYLLGGEITAAIDNFLVNGTVPADGTVYSS